MISDLLIRNVQKSIDIIQDERYVLFGGIIEKGVGLEPVFENDQNNRIFPKQPEIFGFYLIRNICRGCLLSFNHLIGGEILLRNKLYSPCLLSIYTSSFHLLHSLYASKGKVIEPLYIVKNGKIEKDSNLVQACFSEKDNKWSFNKLIRDHKKRWRLLNDLYREKKQPDFFEPLFQYWFGNLIKENIPFTEYYKRSIVYGEKFEKYSFSEKINEFVDHFIEFRHMASYNSFASDIYFYDYVINSKPGDLIPDKFDNHCRMYLSFTNELLNYSVNSIRCLLNNIKMKREYRKFLWCSINQPYFDALNFDGVDERIEKELNDIMNWFNMPRQRKI